MTASEIEVAIDHLTADTDNGSELYATVDAAVAHMRDGGFDEDRINGVVLLSDGPNEGAPDDPNAMLAAVAPRVPGQDDVRFFTIAYGDQADTDLLTQLARASFGTAYDATDTEDIGRVFIQAVANFSNAILRRPAIYVAALVVGGVGLAVGLPWWVAASVAVVSMFAGAAVSAWLFARGEPATSPLAPIAAIEGQSVFRLEREFWTIAYRGGAVIHLPRSKGLRYISRLLQTPGVEVHVLELAATPPARRGRPGGWAARPGFLTGSRPRCGSAPTAPAAGRRPRRRDRRGGAEQRSRTPRSRPGRTGADRRRDPEGPSPRRAPP